MEKNCHLSSLVRCYNDQVERLTVAVNYRVYNIYADSFRNLRLLIAILNVN